VRTALASIAIALLVAACTAPASHRRVEPHGVIGVDERHLDPGFWIGRAATPGRVVFNAQSIAAQNRRLRKLDPSLHDIEQLPSQLPRAQVRGWIEELSGRQHGQLVDDLGTELAPTALDALVDSAALDAIPESRATRYGLIVRRANLRTFPTRMSAYRTKGDSGIDRFQESAAFPGTPVAIAHESRDGRWWFVVTPDYAAWVEKECVAIGPAEQVFGYARRSPYLVVTGANVKTVHTPERPEVSELQLDMGIRLPLRADWPAGRPVNGQHAYAGHVIELPVRAEDGSLDFAAALVPRTADVATGYLPLTRANLLRQGFKFLGERYGWGHSNNARDCSGFVSEVYRSFGVELPRNSRDQGESPALNRISFTDSDSRAKRAAAVKDLEIGDLVFIPGHVMMVIGRDHGSVYVIHDTTGITYRRADGGLTRVRLNGVSVTPLAPLLLDENESFIDGMYSIQRIRP
jgi:SH3 domain (SH3b1 type)/NlpC/P60 family